MVRRRQGLGEGTCNYVALTWTLVTTVVAACTGSDWSRCDASQILRRLDAAIARRRATTRLPLEDDAGDDDEHDERQEDAREDDALAT